MVFDVKTTLNIDEGLIRRLKAIAAKRGETMSHLVEAALRSFLKPDSKGKTTARLPTFDAGECRVDICDRDALYGVMER